jgi:hypothetical protein
MKEKRLESHRRPPTAIERALALVAAGLAVASAILALLEPATATSSATLREGRHYGPDPATKEASLQQQGRPPTAIECALALVAAGLAVATAMLALLGSAAAASSATLPEEGVYAPGPTTTVSYPRASPTATPRATPSPTAAPTVTPTPVPSPRPSPTPARATPEAQQFMPMPVEGTWRVICGYRCGLHDEEHMSTFAIDISLDEGKTAGQPVRSPVKGRIIAVEDSSIYICDGNTVAGIEAGSVIVIDFEAPSGSAQRLRLAHIDPASVPDKLRPDGRPVPVKVGTALGSVAKMDRCSHLHISLTRLDGRKEVPKPLTIEGTLLKDCEGDNCWRDALIPCEDR